MKSAKENNSDSLSNHHNNRFNITDETQVRALRQMDYVIIKYLKRSLTVLIFEISGKRYSLKILISFSHNIFNFENISNVLLKILNTNFNGEKNSFLSFLEKLSLFLSSYHFISRDRKMLHIQKLSQKMSRIF